MARFYSAVWQNIVRLFGDILQGDNPDERPYVRGFSCAENRPERCQLVWERDENCDQTKLAIPINVAY